MGILASQDIFGGPAHVLYGLGQEAGSLEQYGLTTSGRVTSPSWGAEFLLAAGTYAGDSASIDINLEGVTCANVFTTYGLTFNDIAAVTKEVRRRDPLTGAIVSTGPVSLPPPTVYEPVAPAPTSPPIAPPSPADPSPPVEPPLAPGPPIDPLPGEEPSPSPPTFAIDLIDFGPTRNWIDLWHPADPGNLAEFLVWPRWRMGDGVVDLRELLINPVENDVFYGSALMAYDGDNASDLHAQSLRHMAAPQSAAVTAPAIPEPSTSALCVLAALALAGSCRRWRA